MKELSVQEQTTVTGGMSWEIAALVLGLVGAGATAAGEAQQNNLWKNWGGSNQLDFRVLKTRLTITSKVSFEPSLNLGDIRSIAC